MNTYTKGFFKVAADYQLPDTYIHKSKPAQGKAPKYQPGTYTIWPNSGQWKTNNDIGKLNFKASVDPIKVAESFKHISKDTLNKLILDPENFNQRDAVNAFLELPDALQKQIIPARSAADVGIAYNPRPGQTPQFVAQKVRQYQDILDRVGSLHYKTMIRRLAPQIRQTMVRDVLSQLYKQMNQRTAGSAKPTSLKISQAMLKGPGITGFQPQGYSGGELQDNGITLGSQLAEVVGTDNPYTRLTRPKLHVEDNPYYTLQHVQQVQPNAAGQGDKLSRMVSFDANGVARPLPLTGNKSAADKYIIENIIQNYNAGRMTKEQLQTVLADYYK